ncbi:MAG: hypothetical protein WCJ58_05745 [bacterium]
MFNLKAVINQVKYDEYGRPSGIIAMKKNPGMSSHDLVYQARRYYHFKKIGHAGALDKFASGLMLILIGKATKMAEQLLSFDKQYQARILFGVKTDTQDIEGKILATQNVTLDLTAEKREELLTRFLGKQTQFVSIFSSVKVQGEKLRILMRDPDFSKEIVWRGQQKFLIMTSLKNSQFHKEFEIPAKPIEIYNLELGKLTKADVNAFHFVDDSLKNSLNNFYYLDITVDCSKGTYIRQLAEDIGSFFDIPAVLVALERSRIGEIELTDTIVLESAPDNVPDDKSSREPILD